MYSAPDPLGGLWCAVCPVAPDPTSMLGELQAATRHAVPCGPRASNTKKSLAGLPVQLGSHVPNARMHVSKMPDVRTIIGMQDLWACSTFNACKTCRQVATVRLQSSIGPVDHSLALLQCQVTQQHGAMLLTECSVAGQ
jgi:hypothetical protein